MNAVIKTGGKQYLVSEGSVIFVEKLVGNEGDKVVFDEVLMLDSKVGILTLVKQLQKVLLLNKERIRKLEFSNTNLKIEVTVELQDIDNLIQKLKLKKLMGN